MRVGIVGSGAMARALGGAWAGAGHEVLVGGRERERAAAAARDAGVRCGTVGEAVEHGDGAVLLAVPWRAGPVVVAEYAGVLAGRTVVDCSNPVAAGFALATGYGPSAAERVAAAAPGVRVVKAFNLCHAGVWDLRPPVFGGRALAVPLCGDDPGALAAVAALVRDAGGEPVSAGPLARAHLLEAAAALLIGLWVGEGVDAQAVAPPLAHAGPLGRPAAARPEAGPGAGAGAGPLAHAGPLGRPAVARPEAGPEAGPGGGAGGGPLAHAGPLGRPAAP
ncbi:NAD(P)-binding domain-containing protein [Kitasatospora sp. NPDC091335]|uniref:NAD(P)-binding domain-containing protein n=1 Tax=Kitasatospora sp. NPDC091335 TaxID=3364085 RepID=UPI00380C1A8B